MSGLGYGGRRRSTRRKSKRGGAKRDEKAHRKMEDATRHTMSRFVRGAVHHRPAAALLSARRPENERALSAYQLSRGPIGMPKIMIVPRDPNLPVRQVESAPGSPNLPVQNLPRRSPGPAIMRAPPRNNPSPVRSAPPSPRNGGRSRKTRRRHK